MGFEYEVQARDSTEACELLNPNPRYANTYVLKDHLLLNEN